MTQIRIDEAVKSVSITHKFDKDELIFLNTSDVLNGEILINDYMKIDALKGQAKKSIQNGDILFSEIRPKNKRFAYVEVPNPEEYVVSTKLMVLRNINPRILQKYFYYYVTSESMLSYLQMRAESRIGSFPQITFDLMSSLKIEIPPLNEQKEIVNKLESLDRILKENKKLLSIIEEYTQLLFHKWFVDFNFPDGNGNPYKDSGGEMVEVDGKMIPKGWNVTIFGKKVSISTGKKDANHSTTDGEFVFFTCSKDQIKSPTYSFDTKAMILAGNGEFWLNRFEGKFEAYQRNYVIESNDTEWFDFLYLYLQKHLKEITKQSSGSIIKYLKLGMITDFKTLNPDEVTLKSFNNIISPLLNKIDLLKIENSILEETRDLLIKKLIK